MTMTDPSGPRPAVFAPMRELSRARRASAALDHDREMALTALFDGMLLGVARYSADPGPVRAGFAIAVRSDSKGAAWAIC